MKETVESEDEEDEPRRYRAIVDAIFIVKFLLTKERVSNVKLRLDRACIEMK